MGCNVCLTVGSICNTRRIIAIIGDPEPASSHMLDFERVATLSTASAKYSGMREWCITSEASNLDQLCPFEQVSTRNEGFLNCIDSAISLSPGKMPSTRREWHACVFSSFRDFRNIENSLVANAASMGLMDSLSPARTKLLGPL